MYPVATTFCPVQSARELINRHRLSIPTDLESLAGAYGIPIYSVPLKGCNGVLLVMLSGRYAIGIDSRMGADGRARFTVAHELGHYFLHTGREFRCSVTMCRYREDREADVFAAELLMPEVHVRYLAGQLSDVRRLAQIFRVSMAAMSIRLQEFGLGNQIAELKRA